METPKKTGLGSSLLLRRTETPAVIPSAALVVPPSDVIPTPETLPSIQPAPETTSVPPIQVSRRSPKKPLVLRDPCTLYIERGVNKQLHLAARVEGRERSEIVTDLLRKHLPKYRVEREE